MTVAIAPPLPQRLCRSALLSELGWLAHGITSRVPGLGLAEGNVGFTAPRDVNDAWQMRRVWCEAVGLNPDCIVRVRQIHGTDVFIAGHGDEGRGALPGQSNSAAIADAIVTATPGLALMTLHADCLPVLLADPINRVVATVHSGWRGTVAGIAPATIKVMQEQFGCRPENVLAFLGPGISCDVNEVGDEVIEAWRAIGPEEVACRRVGERWRFDVKAATRWTLLQSGVTERNIEESPICTVLDGASWFSHRGQGPDTGRFAAIVGIREAVSS